MPSPTTYPQSLANGNLTADPYQGITHISYDVLNKTDTTVITSGSTYITYTYDAGGNLLRKKAYNSGVLTQTDYIDGFVYTGTGTQTLSYAPMPEGRLLTTSLTQEFVITDPQGNARVSFQNNSGVAKVTQENSYYGYGLQMPGSLVGFSSPPNKNMYNGGSEWQNDTKSVNAGVPDYYQTFYRNYDPTLGRFIGVDPMAEGSASMGVYHFAGDNPIMGNDPGGDKLCLGCNLGGGNLEGSLFYDPLGTLDSWAAADNAMQAEQNYQQALVNADSDPTGLSPSDALRATQAALIADNAESGSFQAQANIFSNTSYLTFPSSSNGSASDDQGNSNDYKNLVKSKLGAAPSDPDPNAIAANITLPDIFITDFSQLLDKLEQEAEQALRERGLDGSVFYGVSVHFSNNVGGDAGFTLPGYGITINRSQRTNIGLLRHEYGHVLEARLLGYDSFYGGILLPSALSAALNSNSEHMYFSTEILANTLSYYYFGEPTDWDFNAYPILPLPAPVENPPGSDNVWDNMNDMFQRP